MSDRMPITRAGYNRMNEELKRLKTVERRDVAQQIEIARGHFDLLLSYFNFPLCFYYASTR